MVAFKCCSACCGEDKAPTKENEISVVVALTVLCCVLGREGGEGGWGRAGKREGEGNDSTNETDRYGVATVSRILKIIGLFCRISSL